MAPVTVRAAATVMLVRDGRQGIEVFMLRRNPASEFVGGVFVFPGGAVDGHDSREELWPLCSGLSDLAASSRLGLQAGGLTYWVAAIRECFEESGLLLAYDQGGSILRLDDPATAERFAEHRRRLDRSEITLTELCRMEGLSLACDSIHYFSHWITPVGPPRRYDTRFFVAPAPEAQIGVHDDRETVANLWVSPAEALARREAGELEMILPTIRNLEAIARFEKVSDLMSAAEALVDIPEMLPRLIEEDGGTRIALPGDPGYEEAR